MKLSGLIISRGTAPREEGCPRNIIQEERSTPEEIVLRPARHPSRGHTRTLGDIAAVLRDREAAGKDDAGDDTGDE